MRRRKTIHESRCFDHIVCGGGAGGICIHWQCYGSGLPVNRCNADIDGDIPIAAWLYAIDEFYRPVSCSFGFINRLVDLGKRLVVVIIVGGGDARRR